MISKVLKNLRKLEKKAGINTATPNNVSYPKSQFQGGTGFRAKQNSQKGAERQRSMGNRNTKPAR